MGILGFAGERRLEYNKMGELPRSAKSGVGEIAPSNILIFEAQEGKLKLVEVSVGGEMPIRMAVVGCGSFARFVHLPNIQRSPEYILRAVVDSDVEIARKAAEEFGAEYSSNEYETVLADNDVDLVMICTPHHLHASMSLAAIHAGKHVFVEKPMALKREDLPSLVKAVRERGVIMLVGFNRRCAPLISKAKELLEERKLPLMINCRMVDAVWRHPWALNPDIGGGRILSEAVHLFDLCSYLVDCEPVRVFAEGGAFTHPEIPGTQDNAVIAMKFADDSDDSIASITIGDLGHSGYPKERVELFFGERTILIDNYQRLEVYGCREERGITLPEVDKGLSQELSEIAKAIRGELTVAATEVDGARATICALKAIEAVHTGCAQNIQPYSTISEV